MLNSAASMTSLATLHLKAEQEAQADSADLILTVLISVIFSETFSAICSAAAEADVQTMVQ